MKMGLWIILIVGSLVPLALSGQNQRIRVLVDPGHGGRDPGAMTASGIKEKDIALAIFREMEVLDREVFGEELDLWSTRYGDTLISLGDRVKVARTLRPDIFISIHLNHAPDPRARGVEVFVPYPKKGDHRKASTRIAENILEGFCGDLGFVRRGVKKGNFQVLRDTREICPSPLVELGFLSNVGEADYVSLRKNIRAMALVLLLAIKKYTP